MKIQHVFLAGTPALALALPLSIPFSAQAQTKGEEPVAEVVVTASRSEQLREQAAVVVDVISRAQIAQSGASTVADLLDDLGGLSVSRSLGRSGVKTTLDIGYMGESAGQNVLILIDGQRLNSLDSADAALAQLPMAAIERVEIRKANAGALYGDRAQGGVINIITRKDNAKEVGVTVGSFESRKADAYMGFASGNVQGSVAVMSARSDGYREHNRSSQSSMHARVTVADDWGSVRLHARVFDEEAQLPGAISPALFASNPRSKGDYPSNTDRTGHGYGLRYDKSLAKGQAVSVDFSGQSATEKSYNAIENTRQTLSPEWRAPWLRGTLLVGAELSVAEANTADGKQVRQTSNSMHVLTTQSLVQHTDLEAAIRSQTVKNHFQTAASASATSASAQETGLSLALRQQVNAQSMLRGGVMKGYRLPNADELYYFDPNTFAPQTINPTIKPMLTQEFFLQFAQKFSAGKWDAHYRKIRASDEIGYQYDCGQVNGANVSCNTNLFDSDRNVLSLNGHWQLSPGLTLRGGVDWIDAQIQSGPDSGKRIPLVPEHSARITVEKSMGTYAVLASTRYRSAMVQASDSAGFYPQMPGRSVVDLGFRTLQAKPWSVSGWVRNVFNKKYYDFATYGGVYPAEGISVVVNAKYTF
jgi:iron complex outermembrane recepter protein